MKLYSIAVPARLPKPIVQLPYHPIGTRNQFYDAIKRVFKTTNRHHFNDALSLSKSACIVMNDLVIDAFQKLLTETQLLMVHQKRTILTSNAVDDAVELLIQHGNFARRCKLFARKSVCKYQTHSHRYFDRS